MKKINEEIGRVLKAITSSVLSHVGGVFMVLGGLDDSPGLGGIGLIITCSTIYFNIKYYKN